MEKTLKNDSEIMKALGVHTIQRLICKTDKGDLMLQIRKGDKIYHLVLDAVPLSKQENKELMALLFPIKQAVIPQVNKEAINNALVESTLSLAKEIKPKNAKNNPKTKKASPSTLL